ENSATASWRRALPDIRLGQYEGLAKKMQQSEWLPDFGPTIFQPAVGATVIGARKLLVAFNISINSRDVRDAIYIAERIRESGDRIVEGSVKKHIPGRLKKLRAIGWFMDEFECAQVSMNLLDYQITSPLKAWEVCSE